jgi:D-serine dehydratase
MHLDEIVNGTVDETFKGMPGGGAPIRLADIGRQGWNVLAEDMPLPVCLLKADAVARNETLMRAFLDRTGAILSPHGKTTMSPQLFERQARAGAWAITVGTVHQVQVARHFGATRIVLANQLVGRQGLRYVTEELAKDPAFEFFCLVDSVAGVAALTEAAKAKDLRGRIGVFLEGGLRGGRTGVRDLDTARAVAKAVKAAEPYVTLRGVEGFEGLLSGADAALRVTHFLDFLCDIARMVDAEDLCGDAPLILTAGGSAFYDIVVEKFRGLNLKRAKSILTRSGCYITHDSMMYEAHFDAIAQRSQMLATLGRPEPALEIWAYVQSRPEPTRALVTMGKRDVSFDPHLPIPKLWYRPGTTPRAPTKLIGHVCVNLNDQHGYLDVPADSPLAVGDMVGFGISHPCLTFDKWQMIAMVDPRYNVTDAIRTYF